MAEDLKKKITFLEKKISILEEVNSQLTKRAEDSMLLRLIAVNLQNLQCEIEVFEAALEKISILKAIPYGTCGELIDYQLKPLATYSSFSSDKNNGYPIVLSDEFFNQLGSGPVILRDMRNIDCQFDKKGFAPQTILFLPFKTKTTEKAAFMFMDDTIGDRLSPLVMVLKNVVEMVVAKTDDIYSFSQLNDVKGELESRIKQRTKDLSRANQILAKEMSRRIAMERALGDSHETFLTVLNSIDATIYVADLNNHEILFMNKYMIDAYGKDFTGSRCYEVLRQEKSPCRMCKNKNIQNKTGNPTGVHVWQGKNPVTGNWYVNYDRDIRWTDGRVVRLQVATDITLLKKMESQLRQSQKFEAIGTLSGGIAHDFNNLLMGIQGHVSLAAVKADSTDPVIEHVKAIEEYVKSATELTSQLLGFARGGKYEVLPIDINQLLNRTAKMFGRTKKEISIQTKFQTPSPVVGADQKQIEQVLLNLFINAAQAMPTGGELLLETKTVVLDDEYCLPHKVEPGKYVMISVSDTGIGMDDKTREQIFDPFFTTKEKGRGTGLGLASAYGIIKNHAGLIMVYSDVGKGATFNIYLPITKEPAHFEKPSSPEELMFGKETILLVDDEEMVVDVGQAMLEKMGYNVIIARSGEEACDTIAECGESVDIVLLDLIMPGIDGGETFDRIRDMYPQLPVLLSSGYSVSGQAAEILGRGCNGFLQKPFNIYKLSQKIRSILDESETLLN